MSGIKGKNLKYYMSLPYTVVVDKVKDEGNEYYYGKIAELDGCHTTANTVEELLQELEGIKKDHIEIKLEYGDPIPEPNNTPIGDEKMPKNEIECDELGRIIIHNLNQIPDNMTEDEVHEFWSTHAMSEELLDATYIPEGEVDDELPPPRKKK